MIDALAYVAQARMQARLHAMRADHKVTAACAQYGPDAEPADVWMLANESMTPEERNAFVLAACHARVALLMEEPKSFLPGEPL